jgi:hypothetical protein
MNGLIMANWRRINGRNRRKVFLMQLQEWLTVIIGIDGRDQILEVALLLHDVIAADAEGYAAEEQDDDEDSGDGTRTDGTGSRLRARKAQIYHVTFFIF